MGRARGEGGRGSGDVDSRIVSYRTYLRDDFRSRIAFPGLFFPENCEDGDQMVHRIFFEDLSYLKLRYLYTYVCTWINRRAFERCVRVGACR